jgi:transposase
MIELVRAGRKPGELAKEFGCHATSITNWVRQADSAIGTAHSPSGALSASERQELIELRRKLRQVQMERDILPNSGPSLPTTATRRLPRLRADCGESGRTTGAHHVQNPQGLDQWLLRLVIHHFDQGSQYTSIAFGNCSKEVAYAHPWELWAMRMTTPWPRASLPAWNVN